MRSTAHFATARVLATAAQALTLVVLARGLGPPDFAVLATILAVAQVAQALADSGCTTAVSRFQRSPVVLERLLVIGRTMSVAAASAAGLALVLADVIFGDWSCLPFLPLVAWVAAERSCEVASMLLAGRGRTGLVGMLLVSRRAVALLCVGAGLVLGSGPNELIVLFTGASAVGSAVALVPLVLAVRRSLRLQERVHDDEAVHLGRVLPGFWLTSMAQQLRALDVVVLSAVASNPVVAAFAPSNRLVPPLRLLPTTYAQLLLARLSTADRPATRREIVLPVALCAVAAAAICVVAPPLVPSVLGAGYRDAVLPLQISVASLPLAAAASVFTSVAQSRDDAGRATVAAWTGGIVTLGAVAALAPALGAPGAAFAGALGFAVQTLLLLVGGRQNAAAVRSEELTVS